MKLKQCPFCGGRADILVEREGFQIIGCRDTSMLCPNPSMPVYPDEHGIYDYAYWNHREPEVREDSKR